MTNWRKNENGDYEIDSRTRCPHCRKDTEGGTHGGCSDCRRVKHTMNGKRSQDRNY